jgi:hypothetical protein
MADRTESSSKDAFGGVIPAADHTSYYEIFRAFNSEQAFLDFARKLKKDSSYRPGALKRTG